MTDSTFGGEIPSKDAAVTTENGAAEKSLREIDHGPEKQGRTGKQCR